MILDTENSEREVLSFETCWGEIVSNVLRTQDQGIMSEGQQWDATFVRSHQQTRM